MWHGYNVLYCTTKDLSKELKDYHSCISDITMMKECDNWCSYFKKMISCTAGCLRIGFLNIRCKGSFVLLVVCFITSLHPSPSPPKPILRFFKALRITMDIHLLDASNEIFYIHWAKKQVLFDSRIEWLACYFQTEVWGQTKVHLLFFFKHLPADCQFQQFHSEQLFHSCDSYWKVQKKNQYFINQTNIPFY